MTIRYHNNTAGAKLLGFCRQYEKRIAITSYNQYRCRQYTYRQLAEYSIQTAGFLLSKGCVKGDNILICAANSGEYTMVLFAAALLGLKVIPVDMNISPNSLNKICTVVDPKVVFTSQQEVMDTLAHIDGFTIPMKLLFEQIADFPVSFDKLMAVYPQKDWYIDECDDYILIFTSGTTSEPKGVPLTHKNFISNITNFKKQCGIPENHQLLSMAPLSHAMGLTLGLYCVLCCGAGVVYVEQLNSETIMNVLDQRTIDAVLTVPAFLNILKDRIEAALAAQGRLVFVKRLMVQLSSMPIWVKRLVFRKILNQLGGHLKWIATGASALNEETEFFWEALGVKVIKGYGLTECLLVTASDLEDRKMGTVGKCLPGQEIRIDDEGEIWVAGPSVFRGYEGSHASNKDLFKDGWLRTGDLGKIDADGHLAIIGRTKNVIMGHNGLNIYPEDIETVVMNHSCVRDCVVLNLPACDDEPYLTALVTLSSHAEDSVDAMVLKEQFNAQLASHQKIAKLQVWHQDDFPRTPSKKIKRSDVIAELKKNRRQLPETSQDSQPSPVLSNQLQDKIVGIIAAIRKRPVGQIALSHRLIGDLGFDSLAMTELIVAMEEQLQMEISTNGLFNQDISVLELVNQVDPSKKQVNNNPATIHVGAVGRGFRAVCRAWFRVFSNPFLCLLFNMRIFDKNTLRQKIAKDMQKRGHIFVANHASHLDGLSILGALPLFQRKKLIAATAHDHFWAPNVKARNFALNCNIRAFPVRRDGNPREYFKTVGKILDRGESVLIFPEGTRTRTGELGPFMPSIGQLIKEMNAPVVPVFLYGMREVWPPKQKLPKPGNIQLRFHKPIKFSAELSPYDIRDHLFDLFQTSLCNTGSLK